MLETKKRITLTDRKRNKYYNLSLIIIAILFATSTFFTQYNPFEILFNYNNLINFIAKEFLPPDITKVKETSLALLQTFEMAVASTFLASIFTFILSFFGSSIIFHLPLLNKIIRLIGSFMRNIPTLVWALILVMAFGIGISVGLLALFITSFGFLLRAYIETIKKQSGIIRMNSNGKIKINNPQNNMVLKIFIIVILFISIISTFNLNIEWSKVILRFNFLGEIFIKLSKFNFDDFDLILSGFADSIEITILATIYSIFAGLLLGAFMATNITPNRPLAILLTSICSFIRAVPTVIWVLLFLTCLGLGPVPGILGLFLHSSAFFAKSFSESFEEIPTDVIEAVKATGATDIQIFFSVILPASFTSLIAWISMRFEINFGQSSILGMVGAGGIGYSIYSSISCYNYGRASISILLVFIFAYLIEIIFTAIKYNLKVN
ncbi:ABC transporter permease subunit [Clostridium sp. LBM24168]